MKFYTNQLLTIFAFICCMTLIGCSNSQNTNESTHHHKTNLPEENPSTISASIVRVVDGDTIKIKLDNSKEETVRLLLVDTPESVHPTKPIQPFAIEASNFVKNLLPVGKDVEIELGTNERDKYGRLLAYLYADEKMVNQLLLEKGYARVAYVFAPNTKYIEEFREIQETAQRKEIGIWSIENYTTSTGFNDQKQKPKATESPIACTNPEIKGNINSKGEKIYHVKGGLHYEQTKPEKLFCNEEEALKAGFRKAKS
ncbi:thermonuclease family protein [Peribacillus huizhouensis]|uniref:Micrococcal nuclease n=1 Tax=Peribacillus huizhouensis TaxID=1501239 RepID=A0ABR6CJI9_9BACI|nr:thermonuclease family protein [Peribacillus huizhouensis]MBA9025059.1 micrococcal nuclease [Peribacillus huizhouensis]